MKDNYERIYIDSAPAFNFFTMSALIAADRVLIPFDCDSFSRQALYGLLTELEDVREEHNEDLAVEGIVVNQFQPRAALPQKMLDELIAEGLPVLPPGRIDQPDFLLHARRWTSITRTAP